VIEVAKVLAKTPKPNRGYTIRTAFYWRSRCTLRWRPLAIRSVSRYYCADAIAVTPFPVLHTAWHTSPIASLIFAVFHVSVSPTQLELQCWHRYH